MSTPRALNYADGACATEPARTLDDTNTPSVTEAGPLVIMTVIGLVLIWRDVRNTADRARVATEPV